MSAERYIIYLLIMALTTYLLRVVPFVLLKKKISNRYVNSFLFYLPYTVLASMTFPAIIYSTTSVTAAVCGLIAAVWLALKGKSLLPVAGVACLMVFLVELFTVM